MRSIERQGNRVAWQRRSPDMSGVYQDLEYGKAIFRACEKVERVMTLQFQACIGPSMSKAHLRQIGADNRLTVCAGTSVVQDYKGQLSADNLCGKCGRYVVALLKLERHTKDVSLTAEIIGVSEIV